MRFFIAIPFLILCNSCTTENKQLLFESLEDSGINFSNDLNYTQELNPYTYRNYYNGAGVGIGDFNNDGLEDIYFTGNQVDNELYRNLGNLQFEQVQNDMISCSGSWSTGVSVVDINADGLLDIYVCKAGPPSGKRRANELFINNGNWIFEERAAEYGLDIKGFSIQASFFDFDRDGDLDCYLLNNSLRSVGSYDLREGQREQSTKDGNKLLVNEDGIYVDKSEELGIYTSNIGFGLGVVTTDINGDSWPDIYVSNDFFERDYYYINQSGTGFKELGEERFNSFSLGSMGADAADYDQDGDVDIFVAEMAPMSLERKKTKLTYDGWDKYQQAIKMGYYHQFPRNMFHEQANGSFSDVSRMNGMSATEWSWAPLIFDFNNDGLMDVFISNGVGKDLLDRDYLNYMADDQKVKELIRNEDGQSLKRLIDIMPSQKVQNAFYEQVDGKQFVDRSVTGVDPVASFSNGSAIADLDNDGDQDMIISNIDDRSFLLENKSNANFIKVQLQYNQLNIDAIGSRVWVYTADKTLNQFVNPYRGFQSSMSTDLIFGLGSYDKVDSVLVKWPNGLSSVHKDIEINTIKTISYENQQFEKTVPSNSELVSLQPIDTISYTYPQRLFNEFNREKLLTQMLPLNHPILETWKNEQEGNEYVYGGSKDHMLSYRSDMNTPIAGLFNTSLRPHVSVIHRFDSDGDGDLDLYVGVGSRQFSTYSPELHDQLYENLGNDEYRLITDAFYFDRGLITAAVEHLDYDGDGDSDLLIAEAIASDNYGSETSLLIYENLGSNKYKQLLDEKIHGQIRDIAVADINNDQVFEIILSGEWMGIQVYNITDESLVSSNTQSLSEAKGLWRDIEIIDIDQDGDLDIIGANQGLNSFYNSNTSLFVSDFDKNGRKEQIVSVEEDGRYYPILDFDEMVMQVPSIRKSISNYQSYATADMTQIFGVSAIEASFKYDLEELRSGVFLNTDGNFSFKAFPREVQKSSMHTIEVADVNGDDTLDILMGGNHYLYKPQFGRDDASLGHLLLGSLSEFGYDIQEEQSLGLQGQMRVIQKEGDNEFWIGIHGKDLVKYKINYAD